MTMCIDTKFYKWLKVFFLPSFPARKLFLYLYLFVILFKVRATFGLFITMRGEKIYTLYTHTFIYIERVTFNSFNCVCSLITYAIVPKVVSLYGNPI